VHVVVRTSNHTSMNRGRTKPCACTAVLIWKDSGDMLILDLVGRETEALEFDYAGLRDHPTDRDRGARGP
jgi:hypothetical protein